MDKIIANLWFDGQAEQAAGFYIGLFPDSHVDNVHRSAADNPSGAKGDVLLVEFTLADCAAAPSLFYADWVQPIGEHYPGLSTYRTRLLARPSVKRCVDGARPYRHFFPPGAPDRDKNLLVSRI